MPVTIFPDISEVSLRLPPEVKSDFQAEARRRGLDAEAYTRFAMHTLAEAFAANPPEDEHQVLLLLSRLENELPSAWKETDENTRLKYALLMLVFWLIARPERLQQLTAAVSAAITELKHSEATLTMRTYSLRELKALPTEQREAIMQAQATAAAPLYAADLALPPSERELTAFGVLNDYDSMREPGEYLNSARQVKQA